MLLADSNWMGLLACFPIQVRLKDGLHGSLDSLSGLLEVGD